MPKPREILAIELSHTHLKMVRVRSVGIKREVVDVVLQEVHEMQDDDISQFIARAAQSWGLAKIGAHLSVPLHTVITRSIEIPSKDQEEIREIVNLQASRHTPYSRSEIVIDILNLGVVRESYTRVLLVIAPRDLITRQTKILQKAGIPIERVFFSPEGLALACSKILNTEQSDAAIGIIHMDYGLTTFLVIQRSKILFVRGIALGAEQMIGETELHAEKYIEELGKSLESYTADEAGPKISQLVLTGALGEAMELDDLFREALPGISLRHQTYFNYFTIASGPRATVSGTKKISFFGAIASALLYDKIKLDLITEERRLEINIRDRARQLITMGILMSLLVALLFGVFASKVYFRKLYLSQLTSRYQKVKEEAKGLEQIFSKTQIIKDYLQSRGESLEALTQVYECLPTDIRLSGLRYDGGEKYTVRGISKTMSSVFSFVTNLEKSPEFQNVKTKYVTARNEDGQDVQDFEIAMIMEKKSAR